MQNKELKCPECLGRKIETVMEETTFTYGVTHHILGSPAASSTPTPITVTIPVRVCANPACGLRWTDYETEEIKEAAIRTHLGKK
jgi:hypothetical protein